MTGERGRQVELQNRGTRGNKGHSIINRESSADSGWQTLSGGTVWKTDGFDNKWRSIGGWYLFVQ